MGIDTGVSATTTRKMTMTPGKAKYFRTAQFNAAARQNFPELPTDPVRVEFSRTAQNTMTGQTECLFDVYTTMDNASFIGTYYENALERFGL
jgi:hypothetical protein